MLGKLHIYIGFITARKQRNAEAMEEASFLEKVTRLELQEKARMEGTESESQESNESLMDIDE